MKHIGIRFRLVLPVVLGFLAIILMMWDYENNRMVRLMGMGWDMGPPFWPYQGVYLLLFALNAPAFVVSMPVLKLLNLQTLPLQYGVWFPAILGWWWWIGMRIDFGVVAGRHYRRPRLFAAVLISASLGLLYIVATALLGEFQWWIEYGRDSSFRVPTLLRTSVPVFWGLVLAGGCATGAMRLVQVRVGPEIKNRRSSWRLTIGATLIALYIFAIHRWDETLNPPPDRNNCQIDRLYGLGCVHGTVLEESGSPISNINVDLIPVNKTGVARWYRTRTERTDEQGRYNLNGVEAGEYLLGSNAFSSYGAPDAERPFATAYYPAAEDESGANPLKVLRSSPLNISPLRLRRLEVVTLKINVLWADGTRPQRSNLYFKNILYPRQAVMAPQLDNGTGEFRLPVGFEYEAMAWVDCDAGKIIESRQSKPDQRIKIVNGLTPAEVTFVIPGPRCTLWMSP